MASPTDLEFIGRVLLATACGAVIGLERQYRSRTAGLRTQALVAAGSAAFVLFGEQAGVPAAPLQITAYVVSGVGFLGGGVILRQGFTVQGLNTAATLWCSAAVGAQAAGGHLVPAVAFTAIVLGIHTFLRPLGRLVDKIPAVNGESVAPYTVLAQVLRNDEQHLRTRILAALARPEVTVRGVAGRTIGDEADHPVMQVRVDIEVEGKADELLDGLVSTLSLEPGVQAISWRADDSDSYGDDRPPRWRWLRRRHSSREVD
jgi:putative Mg2+ transporter-C (MgtC) family protein